jgi:RND superfamily putative drug exporter
MSAADADRALGGVPRAAEALASLAERHRKAVIVVWAILLLASLGPFAKETDHLTSGGYEVPGSQSHTVEAAAHHFAGLNLNQLGVLVVPAKGPLNEAQIASARSTIARTVAAIPSLHVGAASATVHARGGGPVEIPVDGPLDEDSAKDAAARLGKRLPTTVGSTHLYTVGQPAVWAGYDVVSKQSLKQAEGVGLPLTIVILVFVFGSLSAALLPGLLGLVSIAVTGALVYAIGAVLPMSEFVSNIASLIGIAVGVDYSLFILMRYRREVAAGAEPPDALRTALATSGRAVVFSGATVALALGGLFIVDSVALRSMALGAILVVAVAVAGALTLTPALILSFHQRLAEPAAWVTRITRRLRRPAPERDRSFWGRWALRVTRRPWLSLLGALAVLVVLAIPAFSMRTATESLPQLPEHSPARVGAHAAVAAFGPAASGPIYLLERYAGFINQTLAAQIARAVAETRGVAGVGRALIARSGREAMLPVVSSAAAESAASRTLVGRLERRLASLNGRGVVLALGGTAAHEAQFDRHIGRSLWSVVAFVLLACGLVIFLLLRSIVLPVKAIVMNVLTVGASFGVLVAIFQWRWLPWLGLEGTGYVSTLSLPFVLAIMFGVSMDYEVFLLARIHEEYRAVGNTRLAVMRALESTGATITSAALIMVLVFVTFVAVSLSTIKMIGLGLAVAVALDATLVRLVLVPAVVVLMGEANWWAPRPFRRRERRVVAAVAGGGD